MDKFSPKHFIFLMMAGAIVALKTYPLVFMDAGRDTWVAVIGSSVLIFLLFLFIVRTMKPAKDVTLLQVYETAWGKRAGRPLILLYCVCVVLALIESASIEADSMHQNMLVETPSWYFLLFFVIPTLYVVRKNLVVVVIICIVGISLIMVAGIHLGVLTTQQKHIQDLFPVLENGITSGFWASVFKSLGQYGGLMLVLPYFSMIGNKRDKLTKWAVIALIIIIQIQIVSITGVYMTFTPDIAQSYYYPKLVQTHLVSYFEMLEFGELYVMLQILGGWLMKYVVAFQALLLVLSSFKLKERALHIVAYVLTALVLAVSWYLTGTSLRLFSVLNWLPWINLGGFIVLPALTFALYRIRRRKPAAQTAAPAKDAAEKA